MNISRFYKITTQTIPSIRSVTRLPLRKCQVCHFGSKTKRGGNHWMKRHVTDPFVRQAQHEGQVSRSYYKLQQMNEKYSLLKKNTNVVVELGAAPGGWTSYVASQLSSESILVAIDLLPLDPRVLKQLSNTPCQFHFIQGDFRSTEVRQELLDCIVNDSNKANLVLSDMAANFTGDSSTDAARTMGLCELALELSIQHLLDENATFVTKYFSCADEVEFRNYARQLFDKVKTVKPPASRKQSAERYLIATGFHNKR